MNSNDNKVNLYDQWKEGKDKASFKTRSPYPDQDYFFSSNPLPKCSNSSSNLPDDCMTEDIENYLKEQIAILRFNNPTFTLNQIDAALSTNIFNWRDNFVLKKDPYTRKKLLRIWISEVIAMDNYKTLIDFEYSRHWYSDRIEKLPANEKGAKWGEKTRIKRSVRTKFYADAVHEDIKELSLMYQEEMNGLLPTLQYLSEATDYSPYQIRTYAKDYFIKKSEHTKYLIQHYLKLHPGLSYEELAKKIDIPVRTIGRYGKNNS